MPRFHIDSIRCGMANNEVVCGPFDGVVVAEAAVSTDAGDHFYLSLAEAEGVPSFFRTAESTYDAQLSMDMSDEAIGALQDCALEVEDYDDVLDDPDAELYPLFRYLIYVVRSESDECKAFMAATAGKYLDEIDVPASDLEDEETGEDD